MRDSGTGPADAEESGGSSGSNGDSEAGGARASNASRRSSAVRETDSSWAAKYMGAGLQFGGAIVLFTLAGVWLDGKLGSSPLFTIAGVFVGFFAGFMSIYTRVSEDVKREEEGRR
jgi:F0F1-type ATP synthase assembly protein I